MREGNNILGVYACDPDKDPVAIRYLEDPEVPGAQLDISPNGKRYVVNGDLEYAVECRSALTSVVVWFVTNATQ